MKLLLIDANSVLNRAFYGVRPLTTKDGLMTNGIFGFVNILLKFIQEDKPDYIAAAFDLKDPTFRHKQYDQYKAQRKGMPDELAAQLAPLKELLDAMNVPRIEISGYEADDIIGTLAKRSTAENIDCVIITGDRDDLQLIDSSTVVKLAVPKGGKTETTLYDEAKVAEQYGLAPIQLIDVKGLMGDTSDNIPGVKGIGEKTALALITQFGSLENLYENLNDASIKEGVRLKLIADKDMAFFSKQLATICLDAPVPSFDKLKSSSVYSPDLKKLLLKLEMNSFISRLGLDKDAAVSENETHLPAADVPAAVYEFAPLPDKAGLKLFYDDSPVFISFSGENFYLCHNKKVYTADIAASRDFLAHFFKDIRIKKAAFDTKAMMRRLQALGIAYSDFAFDAILAGYILNPASTTYSPETLAGAYLSESADTETGGAATLSRLYPVLSELIEKNGQHSLFYDIELPLAAVLADMEAIGFYVDRDKLFEFGEMLQKAMDKAESTIFYIVGHHFNINSTKQLAAVLFEELKLPPLKKTKTGYSTNAEVLEKLKGSNEVIDLILEFRQLAKLKSTYADGLLKVISPDDNRIHTSFNQTVTQTGRLSSTEPNLQNIPIRHEMGREIRRMFMAKPGCVLIDGDYSQIELRILAHISGDENLINAFREGTDIHAMTASQVFNVPLDMVTGEMRSRAKAVNFGIMYGIGDFSLAQDIKVSRAEAKAYIENYFARYPKVKEFLDHSIETAKEKGYVETIFRRRRYIPELKSKNANERSFGQRVAMNSPIQGTAADIIKIAMVRVHNRLRHDKLKARLILQVHDELVLEAPYEERMIVSLILKDEMEKAVDLSVHMLAEVASGESWYDAH